MTREEAINVLKTRSCYECSWGCDSPVSCHCGGCDLAEATRIAIESLEAFGWIPTSERLPEEDGHYIVAIKNGWFPNNVIPIDILRYEGGKWKYYFGFENDDFEDDDFENPITAWMPLPEPYEEAGE